MRIRDVGLVVVIDGHVKSAFVHFKYRMNPVDSSTRLQINSGSQNIDKLLIRLASTENDAISLDLH